MPGGLWCIQGCQTGVMLFSLGQLLQDLEKRGIYFFIYDIAPKNVGLIYTHVEGKFPSPGKVLLFK